MGKHVLHIALAMLCCVALFSCDEGDTPDRNKWRVTLNRTDKKPYGTYLAYQSLKYYFPDSKIEPLSPKYRFTSMNDDMLYGNGNPNLMILVGLDFRVSEIEWEQLKQFARNGNELIIFCSNLDGKIETDLNQEKKISREEQPYDGKDTSNLDAIDVFSDSVGAYGYRGRSLQGYFETIDKQNIERDTTATNIQNETSDSAFSERESNSDTVSYIYGPDTIGFTHDKPNILSYSIGSGHIILHAAPLAISNYFLLQNHNIDYLTWLWRIFPKDIDHVYWGNYYVRSAEESSFSILWRYPSTRWALILTFFVLGLYILFQMKRRQRIIPIVAPLKNDSVTFVETVGRLYYNKGNHRNLAEKMVQQYLEWIRMHYYLNTNLLNDEFIKQLVMKSGKSEAIVHGLINMIQEIKSGKVTLDDAYLYQLHQAIQQFYKNKK